MRRTFSAPAISPSHPSIRPMSNPMEALDRLVELFPDRSVGELAIILDKHGNDVKEAAWSLLNGESAAVPAEAADEADEAADDAEGKAAAIETAPQPGGHAPAEIQRLYDEGAITKEEYELMIEADQRAAEYRESRKRGESQAIADAAAAELEEDDDGKADDDFFADSISSSMGTATAEIQRLYAEGTITKEECDEMVKADRTIAKHRESRIIATPPIQPQTQTSTKLKYLGAQLKKLNLAAAIDQMEKDQEYADQLDRINQDLQQEVQMKDMVREAEQNAMNLMEEHLEEFLRGNPRATYESWIAELHPDNVQEGKLLDNVGSYEIDHRFYVVDSDHRRLWNESLSARNDGDRRDYVNTRSSSPKAEQEATRRRSSVMRDLLSGSETFASEEPMFEALSDDARDVDLLQLDSDDSNDHGGDASENKKDESSGDGSKVRPDPQSTKE